MKEVLDKYKFSRGAWELFLSLGGQFGGVYNNTIDSPSFPGVSLPTEFSAINAAPSVGLGFLRRINNSVGLEIRGDYAFVPFSSVLSHSGETNNNFIHRVNVLGAFRINGHNFGNRGQHQLSYIAGFDIFYNNSSDAYNGYNIFLPTPGYLPQLPSDPPADLPATHGIIQRGFFNTLGATFVGGVSVGFMFKDTSRIIIDLMLGVGPTAFFDTLSGSVAGPSGASNPQASFLSHTNVGLNAAGILNLAYHVRVKKSAFWVTFEMRNRVRLLVLPLLESSSSVGGYVPYHSPLSVFGYTELSIGGLASF